MLLAVQDQSWVRFICRQDSVYELYHAACPFIPEHACNTNPSILRLDSSSLPNG